MSVAHNLDTFTSSPKYAVAVIGITRKLPKVGVFRIDHSHKRVGERPLELNNISLSKEESKRYERQIILFGSKGQLNLKDFEVAIIGVGGLWCPVVLCLVAAGVGKIKMIDSGRVAISDLNQQILYQTADIGQNKVKVCKKINGIKF
ncbi:MAG TPA: ThiF family adenylyltransferase [Candidatus Paceibacterota bacterium]|nr:ThiF family adenylyltransferase [Candidatus Paceibacterota bacterium]HOV88444.1 ThiF family adenylyltransferase [Candidatus Paceibacterota bacterium]